jgi:two-component system, OmpR family, phosphate regulon sensor histidine kinase PhoR
MPEKRTALLWQIYPPYLAIMLAAIVWVGVLGYRHVRSVYLREVSARLESTAALVRQQMAPGGVWRPRDELDAMCLRLGKVTDVQLAVAFSDGRVVGDTRGAPGAADPEVVAALGGRIGRAVRYSPALGVRLLYLGYPVVADGAVIGAILTAVPLGAIDETLAAVAHRIAAAAVGAALGAAGIGWILVQRIRRPLRAMRKGVERFARGDLDARLEMPRIGELADLAEAMNRMAAGLEERRRALAHERNEHDAILGSMAEGVLAVSRDGRVVKANEAAGLCLGTSPQRMRGRLLQEVARHPDLQKLIADVAESGRAGERDLQLADSADRVLSARVGPWRGADGRQAGVIIVLNDVTRLRHLERVRREFAGNVSHELRTPVTSIQGFVETLEDGALENPEDARRFLGIIRRQVARLNQLVTDILTLSSIEQDGKPRRLATAEEALADIVGEAVGVCADRAAAKQVEVGIACDPDLRAEVHAALLVQALVNLVDNAIKFSEAGGRVEVSATRADGSVQIQVTDHGIGIESRHLSRIFERFYRIDKGRSRAMGGTGLGLSIVRHVAKAHGGDVAVASTPGQGSIFRITLPSVHA